MKSAGRGTPNPAFEVPDQIRKLAVTEGPLNGRGLSRADARNPHRRSQSRAAAATDLKFRWCLRCAAARAVVGCWPVPRLGSPPGFPRVAAAPRPSAPTDRSNGSQPVRRDGLEPRAPWAISEVQTRPEFIGGTRHVSARGIGRPSCVGRATISGTRTLASPYAWAFPTAAVFEDQPFGAPARGDARNKEDDHCNPGAQQALGPRARAGLCEDLAEPSHSAGSGSETGSAASSGSGAASDFRSGPIRRSARAQLVPHAENDSPGIRQEVGPFRHRSRSRQSNRHPRSKGGEFVSSRSVLRRARPLAACERCRSWLRKTKNVAVAGRRPRANLWDVALAGPAQAHHLLVT